MRPRDFKSLASTSFAMSAAGLAPGERNSRPGRAGQRSRRLPAPARRPPRNDGLKGRRNNLVIARSDSDVAIHPSARSAPTMDCRVGPAGLLAMTRSILQNRGGTEGRMAAADCSASQNKKARERAETASALIPLTPVPGTARWSISPSSSPWHQPPPPSAPLPRRDRSSACRARDICRAPCRACRRRAADRSP